MTEFICTFDLPPRALNPNVKRHWAALSAAKAAYKRSCWLDALAALDGREAPQWVKATIQYAFYWPAKHRVWDDDNAMAAMKVARDALCVGKNGKPGVGIVLDDKGLTTLPCIIEIDPELPRVVVQIVPEAKP